MQRTCREILIKAEKIEVEQERNNSSKSNEGGDEA